MSESKCRVTSVKGLWCRMLSITLSKWNECETTLRNDTIGALNTGHTDNPKRLVLRTALRADLQPLMVSYWS